MKALALLCLTGCDLLTDSFVTNDFSGDPFPIGVDTTSGAVVVGVREGDVDRVGVLDTLSPFTLVDPGIDETPRVTSRTLTLLGTGASGQLDLPRAQVSPDVISLHPCDGDPCVVGPTGMERPYQAIVGANALAGDALRLRLGDDQIRILADVAGDDEQRAEMCDAVYPSPYRGGGTLVVAGTELDFSGRRITMPTCLGANPDPDNQALPQSARGADALMLISTGIGPSLLGESAYLRYQAITAGALPLDQLLPGEVSLASGKVAGRVATVTNMALVARSSSTPRAACRHVYAHHLFVERFCAPGDDCPCEDGKTFCPLPAMVELNPAGGLEVLVVPDNDPTLQALRAELRPNQAEVDGVLGTSALRALEMDVDYPHDRVLARCTTADCTMRIAYLRGRDFAHVVECLTTKL